MSLRQFLFSSGARTGAQIIEFRATLSTLSGQVDKPNGIIRGVSLITSGVTARGHDLQIDDTTLQQLLACAEAKGQVPVKLDHQSGVQNVCGYIDNFRVEGTKLLGDWHLLKSHKEYETTLEKAERMPGCFGLSAAFLGAEEVLRKTGKKAARCTELLSVDCVTQPAANPDGLFEARQQNVRAFDNAALDNMNSGNSGATQNNGDKEPTLADIMAAVSGLTQRLDQQQQLIESLQADDGDNGDLTAEDLEAYAAMSDEELQAEGITRQQVDAAIADWNANVEAEAGDDAGDDDGVEATAATGAEAATALNSMHQVINFLEAKTRAALGARKDEEVEQHFAALEGMVTELSAQNAALQNQLLLGGGQPVPNSGEANVLFEAKDTQFQGTFEHIVTTKFQELMHAGGITELAAKSKALDFGIKKHGREYDAYRKRNGKIHFEG